MEVGGLVGVVLTCPAGYYCILRFAFMVGGRGVSFTFPFVWRTAAALRGTVVGLDGAYSISIHEGWGVRFNETCIYRRWHE